MTQGCCGINGVEDYVSPIITGYQQRGHLSDSDAYTIPNSCCQSGDKLLKAKCKQAKESYIFALLSGSGNDEDHPVLKATASDPTAPKYLHTRKAHESRDDFPANLYVHDRVSDLAKTFKNM